VFFDSIGFLGSVTISVNPFVQLIQSLLVLSTLDFALTFAGSLTGHRRRKKNGETIGLHRLVVQSSGKVVEGFTLGSTGSAEYAKKEVCVKRVGSREVYLLKGGWEVNAVGWKWKVKWRRNGTRCGS
jgi:hypothetical protein